MRCTKKSSSNKKAPRSLVPTRYVPVLIVVIVRGKRMKVEGGSFLSVLVTLLSTYLIIVESVLVEEPHYGEKFYQYGYQVEDLYTGEMFFLGPKHMAVKLIGVISSLKGFLLRKVT